MAENKEEKNGGDKYVCIYDGELILRVKVDENFPELAEYYRQEYEKDKERIRQEIKKNPKKILNEETLEGLKRILKKYENLTDEEINAFMKELHKKPDIVLDYDEIKKVIEKIKEESRGKD